MKKRALSLVVAIAACSSNESINQVASSAAASSSAGSGGNGGSSGCGAGGGSTICDASAVNGIAIAPTDVYGGPPYALGYPPYAIDACKLVYVAPSPAELRLRDLSTGVETTIAPESE